MPLYVEWYEEHVVEDPAKMAANQSWAEGIYEILRDGGIAATEHGAYQKRDGDLHVKKKDRGIRSCL